MPLKIAARKSTLARLQAYQVGEALQEKHPGLKVQYVFRESLGDKNLHDPLWKMPEKGVFTEDFREDLLQEKADIVVHSWKDLPVVATGGTKIVATLPRADQRDLLLFKKKSFGAPAVNIYSSSPRREYHLQRFLPEALPWQVSTLTFTPVRGNIQTRVRKWLEDSVDGLVVAKAAIDRLLSWTKEDGPEIATFLREALRENTWMVLPLEACPNAPAQGALAIEIKEGRAEIETLLRAVHCPVTFSTVQWERSILREYGGGCHQKIGAAAVKKSYGTIHFASGETEAGDAIYRKEFIRDRALPETLAPNFSVTFSTTRKDIPVSIPSEVNAVFVARDCAFDFSGFVWCSGRESWKKLAARGIWVHGSSESLGEENPAIDILTGKPLVWARLTHDKVAQAAVPQPSEREGHILPTYSLELSLRQLDPSAGNFYFWKSASQAQLAFAQEPRLREAFHACGPGRTYKALQALLGGIERVFVFLNEQDWKDSFGGAR